jgi:hypothetical protein
MTETDKFKPYSTPSIEAARKTLKRAQEKYRQVNLEYAAKIAGTAPETQEPAVEETPSKVVVYGDLITQVLAPGQQEVSVYSEAALDRAMSVVPPTSPYEIIPPDEQEHVPNVTILRNYKGEIISYSRNGSTFYMGDDELQVSAKGDAYGVVEATGGRMLSLEEWERKNDRPLGKNMVFDVGTGKNF